MANNFIHLHIHTHHSLLDGVASPEAILIRAKELGFKAIAITDHGTMGAHLEAQLHADKIGIKVIFGMESYIVNDHTIHTKEQRGANHIILLTANEQGYKNLIKLNNIAWRDGFYYTPRIDLNLIAKNSSGLVCLSSCAKGIIAGPILGADFEQAKTRLLQLKKIFGKNLYLELQAINIPDDSEPRVNLQDLVNKYLISLSIKYDIDVVVTNDVHFLKKGDDVLQTNLVKIQRENFVYAAPDNWLKTFAEIFAAFKKYCPDISGEWLFRGAKNTIHIANMCNYKIPAEGSFNIPNFDHTKHPSFRLGLGNKNKFFASLLADKAEEFGYVNNKTYIKRLNYEFGIISKLGVIDYFLIVEDLFNFARKRNALCHTRGSVNGSLVAYLLGFGVVDPIKHNILFERFLSPARLLTGRSDIDIDCDFEAEFRPEAIKYLMEKYGKDRICQVGSYSRMQLKMAIKDMGRIRYEETGDKDFSYKKLNQITRLMLGNNIEEELDSGIFKSWYDANAQWLRNNVLPVVGNPRAFSGHPAAVAVTCSNIDEWLPIRTQLDKKQGGNIRIVATAWENSHTGREDLFARGIMCLDCLGVKTLSIIAKCFKDIKKIHKKNISLKTIPLDDIKTMDAFKRGETMGVFQLSAPKITAIIKEMKPDRFEDIIALGALDRPGPLSTNAHTKYIRRKHGNELPDFLHNSLKDVLKDTYGVPIYSEHMMLMTTEFAGMDMIAAEKMRQVVKAKDPKVFKDFKKQFIESAMKKWGAHIKSKAQQVWNAISAFGSYAFPKGHSTAYAFYGVATQFLKTNYPVIFFKNFLDYADHDEYAEIKCVAETEYAVKFALPDINKSKTVFSIGSDCIIWPLTGIKGVGVRAAVDIVNKQPFVSFDDFFNRVNRRVVNKRVVEAFICCDVFRDFGNRYTMIKLFYELRKEKIDSRNKWMKLANDDEWNIEASNYLGFDMIDIKQAFGSVVNKYRPVSYKDFVNTLSGTRLTVVGKVVRTHRYKTNNGKDMMFVDLAVDGQEIPVVVWPDTLTAIKSQSVLPKKGSYIIIGGLKGIRQGKSQITMEVDCYVYEVLG